MNILEFQKMASIVADLWPKWALVDPKCPEKSNWNSANRANIFNLLSTYDAEDCCRALRKQRQWEPDGTKPSWTSVVNDLRSTTSVRGKTPEEQEVDDRAVREARRMIAWGRANKHRLDEIEQDVYRQRPELKEVVEYAKRLHADARVWVCEQWDRGDKFEGFGVTHGR